MEFLSIYTLILINLALFDASRTVPLTPFKINCINIYTDEKEILLGSESGELIAIRSDDLTSKKFFFDNTITKIVTNQFGILFISNQSKSAHFISRNLSKRWSFYVGREVKNVTSDKDGFYVATDRTILKILPNKKVKWVLKVPSEIKNIETDNKGIFVVLNENLWSISHKGEILWKSHYRSTQHFDQSKYLDLKTFEQIIPLKSKVIVIWSDSLSHLLGVEKQTGRILWKKKLPCKIESFLPLIDGVLLSTVSLKTYGCELIKISDEGKIVNRKSYPTYFFKLEEIKNRIFGLSRFNEIVILNEHLDEIFVDYLESPYFMIEDGDVDGDGFVDLFTVFFDPKESKYFGQIHFCRIGEYLSQANDILNKSLGILKTSPEKAIFYLSSARYIFNLFDPELRQFIDQKMAYASGIIKRKRLMKRTFWIISKTLLFLIIIFLLTAFLKKLWLKITRKIDYDALRKMETGFFHSTKRKLNLLKGLYSLEGGQQNERKSYIVLKALGIAEELKKTFEEYNPLLERILWKKFSPSRYYKNLNKFKKTLSSQIFLNLYEEIFEYLAKELSSYQLPIEDLIEKEIERLKVYSKRNGTKINLVKRGEARKSLFLDHWEYYKIILRNFLDNAFDALKENKNGDKKIELILEGPPHTNGYRGRILIKDNGKGMDEKTINNFWRKGYTNKRKGQGLGVTEEIVAFLQSNGGFEVASKPGKGTTVTIMIK